MSDPKQDPNELAKRLFGHLKPEEIPSVEKVLSALQIAKGVKFRFSPEKLAAIRTKQGEITASTPQCNDNDWCITCDAPRDICRLCDLLDCGPTYRDVD
jgi:hypothetical protein